MSAVSNGQDFPRSARLLTARDYRHVFNRRQSLRSRHFALYYFRRQLTPQAAELASELTLNEPQGARLGLVVGKRRLSGSVQRNQMKRVAREAFRTRRSELPSVDLVLRLQRNPMAGRVSPARWRRALAQEIGFLLNDLLSTVRQGDLSKSGT